MLDLWTLRVLVEVADQGSFSGAAATLSMTQPAVSRQIAGMERRVGVPLFQRVPRGVRPTTAGEVAVEQARDILARAQALEARLGSFTELTTGKLRLSAFASANTSFMPEAIRRLSRAYPGITVSLTGVDTGGAIAAIRDGTVDLALLTAWDLYRDPMAAKYDPAGLADPISAVDGIDLVPLLDEELLVGLPATHRLADQPRVRLRDLRDDVWVEGGHPDCLGPIPRLTEALGGAPRIGFHCEDWNGKQALVAAGAAVMLVPTLAQAAIRRGVVLRPTSPRLPARRLFAATAAPPFRMPAVAAMLSVLAALSERQRPARPRADAGRS
jgi:DNA-binding transcriptional LysR family regulator